MSKDAPNKQSYNLFKEVEPLLWIVAFVWIFAISMVIFMFIFHTEMMMNNKQAISLLPAVFVVGAFVLFGLLKAHGE